MNEKGVLWGRGQTEASGDPMEREEIKHDIPLPTGYWFALWSL